MRLISWTLQSGSEHIVYRLGTFMMWIIKSDVSFVLLSVFAMKNIRIENKGSKNQTNRDKDQKYFRMWNVKF
jgi:hypothetical protein